MMDKKHVVLMLETIIEDRKYWRNSWHCWTPSIDANWRDFCDGYEEIAEKHKASCAFIKCSFLWWKWIRVVDRRYAYMLHAEGDTC